MALLHMFNVAAMKRKFADLQSSYQLRENDTTVPYFTLVSPFLLRFIIRKSKRTRTAKLKKLGRQIGSERDMYFKTYSRMWNK
ncbi:hypothetical protein COOONC_02441 [Cooperia oncophora]